MDVVFVSNYLLLPSLTNKDLPPQLQQPAMCMRTWTVLRDIFSLQSLTFHLHQSHRELWCLLMIIYRGTGGIFQGRAYLHNIISCVCYEDE